MVQTSRLRAYFRNKYMIKKVEKVTIMQRNHITNSKYYRDHKHNFATSTYSWAFEVQESIPDYLLESIPLKKVLLELV